MQRSTRLAPLTAVLAVLALLVLGVVAIPTSPASAVTKPAKPTGLEVHMENSLQEASFNWNGVAGAKYYGFEIIRPPTQGPVPYYSTSVNTYVEPWDKFPFQNATAGGYKFLVSACNSAGCSTAQGNIKTKFGSGTVSTSNKQSAADKANSCAGKGDAAGVTTAAGGGIALAISSWIPVVGEVTAAGVGAAIAGATGGTFIACELGF